MRGRDIQGEKQRKGEREGGKSGIERGINRERYMYRVDQREGDTGREMEKVCVCLRERERETKKIRDYVEF